MLVKMEISDKEFYGPYYGHFLQAKELVENVIKSDYEEMIEHYKVRIKSKNSAQEKLRRLNVEVSTRSAIENLNDIIGIRIVCRFLTDVYNIVDAIKGNSQWNCIICKDYITFPKPNGYRSYHMIVEVNIEDETIPVEIQLRTISQDTWASLEHKMKYKKEIEHVSLIQTELKRLADEMASSDVCMQTLSELINGSK